MSEHGNISRRACQYSMSHIISIFINDLDSGMQSIFWVCQPWQSGRNTVHRETGAELKIIWGTISLQQDELAA